MLRNAVGALALLFLALHTAFWCLFLYPVAALRLLVPVPAFPRLCARVLVAIAEAWIAGNSAGLALTQPTVWDVRGLEGLSPGASYLVVSNHQSWADIPVLQRVFLRRIPFLRFFL